jgi:hypothetical protein
MTIFTRDYRVFSSNNVELTESAGRSEIGRIISWESATIIVTDAFSLVSGSRFQDFS